MKKLFGSVALIIVLATLASPAHAQVRVCGAAVTSDGYFIETASSNCPKCTQTPDGQDGYWVYGGRIFNKVTKLGCTFYFIKRPINAYSKQLMKNQAKKRLPHQNVGDVFYWFCTRPNKELISWEVMVVTPIMTGTADCMHAA